MPKKPSTTTKEPEGNILVGAAKAIGAVAGKLASRVNVPYEGTPTPKTPRVGKLLKKNKHRLPRRQKKALQKKAVTHIG